MNIKIVDSWLKEYLETKASVKEIARELSLTSASVERIEKVDNDNVYDIEITTNRPDLMSIIGIAKEASAALPEQGIPAKFISHKPINIKAADISFPIEIINNPKLCNRIMAVVMEVEIGVSPKKITDRLEASGIRSLNNLIDVTNYVMREIGHPSHVFDYDLLNTKKMVIRESKKGEELTTLDNKEYRLLGGDIVADNGKGEIIDLLGVMGTKNSVVQNNTKRILFFLDNCNPLNIRKTSMSLGIRTEAAVINEKGIDPELVEIAFKRGVELYQQIANGKVISKVLDIYPNKAKTHTIKVKQEKINKIIGVEIEPSKSVEILNKLGFTAKINNNSIEAIVPTIRSREVLIDEDIIEEIARVYGYHKLPSTIPQFLNNKNIPYANSFYFEDRVKNALKYLGFNEVYTYSLISENQFVGPIEKAIKLKNPLSEDMKYLRNSLIPNLIQAIENNKDREKIKLFELSNVYEKVSNDLPIETLMLSGIIKNRNISFFEVKGLIEIVLIDLGIKNYKFKNREEGGAKVLINDETIGYIEIINNNIVDFELNFEKILKFANLKKVYKPLAKFPPIVEDITFTLDDQYLTQDVINEIKLQSILISEATLIDQFENSKTFHIIYQSQDRNLTNIEIKDIRKNIIDHITKKFNAQVK